jgi:hypothetical protein
MRQGCCYEIGIHPGYPAHEEKIYPQENYNKFISSEARKREYDLLFDGEIRMALEKRNIKIISYRDL